MSLKIEQKDDTPSINLQEGLIEIEGRSLPENVLLFYTPVINWVRKYCKNPKKITKINISLAYTNSSSLKCIVDILYLLDTAFVEGNKMELNWIYEQEDDSIFEIAQDLKSFLKMPVKTIEKEIIANSKKRVLIKNIKTGKIGEISQLYWEAIQRNGHARNFMIIDK
ncbi:MAG: DUF1987 domain-containing protein [Bacteroidales bacterium]|jgi:hypothetical protein|nr:DUF1987 domain-containing protein [Bacteroidales bacterium]